MKRSFHYFDQTSINSYIKNNRIPDTSSKVTTIIEIVNQFDQTSFDGYIFEQGVKLSRNNIHNYAYYINFRKGEKGYFTSDGKTYYELIALNFDEYDYSILSLKKGNPYEEKIEVAQEVNIEKNRRKRKPIPNKIRVKLQKEIESKCPFCKSEEVENFEIHHINGDIQDNSFENLIMICPTCHTKIEKGDITEGIVKEIKFTLSKIKKPLTAMEIAQLEDAKIEDYKYKFKFLASSESIPLATEEVQKLFTLIQQHCAAMTANLRNINIFCKKTSDGFLQVTASNIYILIQWYPSYDLNNSVLSVTFNKSWSIEMDSDKRYKFRILQFSFDIGDSRKNGWRGAKLFYNTAELADYLLKELIETNKIHERRND